MCALLACRAVWAQAWSTEPIRLIVPYTLAGTTDAQARALASGLSKEAGWKVVVANRPGSAGSVGLEALAKSRPDGHTLAVGQTANMVIHQAMELPRPFDVAKAFTPITLLSRQPVVLVVRTGTHASLVGLLATARSRDLPLVMVSAANGSVGHLAGELMMKRAVLLITHIPYTGAAPALSALVNGHADFAFPTVQAAVPMVKAGRLRVLAVSSEGRQPQLPQVPTLSEAGFPGLVVHDWKLLIGPAGLPLGVQQTLRHRVLQVLKGPSWADASPSDATGAMPQPELHRFLDAERQHWRQLVREVFPGSR
ncbi:tripartite tricarboxylate transporter substrate binding protein [Hydrogenophaga sp.]|uniref:Bug family tripartite tricarboxylate transporter substrate binding protein n=1 Tax=Hydrogenophaga sp. TaxID=1904254 RepID=UPI002AC985E9|nr:tripartite tricarboxylate transporter substrate binding protein [Hydrogenophaga sp.]